MSKGGTKGILGTWLDACRNLPLAKCERRSAMGFERRQITHFQKPAKTVSARWWSAIMDSNHTMRMACFGDKAITGRRCKHAPSPKRQKENRGGMPCGLSRGLARWVS